MFMISKHVGSDVKLGSDNHLSAGRRRIFSWTLARMLDDTDVLGSSS